MIEINLNKVKKNYGFNNVLDDFDLEVKTGERVALIGPNGCGKTTIFKIIVGEENINSGTVSIRKGATIGMLSQTPLNFNGEYTVKEVLTDGLKEIVNIEKEMRELEIIISTCSPERMKSTLNKYSKLQELFEKNGGYEFESMISKVCNGFKISGEMLERPFNTLSGGEKTIVSLASLILSKPSILLLDEPTNHLDIDTLEWFEGFLRDYNGTIIISSHDRYFLDKVVTKVVLIDKGKSEVFFGNYSYFLIENERRTMAEFEQYKNQQKKIEAMKNTIKKLKEWGRIGNNEKFFKRAFSIEKRLEKMELYDNPETKKEVPLDFEFEQRSGKDVLSIKDLDISFGDKLIFKKTKIYIKYGEKICLMGKNGSGKSTLVKALLGNAKINNGEIKIGSNVSIGYIPQEIKFDDDNETVLSVAKKNFFGTETQLRVLLAKFLFYNESVFKRVGQLSGGEKVRLKLFDLIQQKANFLILDEPTNHIDIETKEMLEESLLEYNGTVLFISHDRYFINKVAEKVLNIENNTIKEYQGNYDYFKEHKKINKFC